MTIEFDKKMYTAYRSAHADLGDKFLIDFIEQLVKAHNELEFIVNDYRSNLADLEKITGLDTVGTDEPLLITEKIKALDESAATQAMEIAEFRAYINGLTQTTAKPVALGSMADDYRLLAEENKQMKEDIRAYVKQLEYVYPNISVWHTYINLKRHCDE